MKLMDGTTLDLSATDAMIATILVVDAFADAFDQTQTQLVGDPDALLSDPSKYSRLQQVGIVLMFDALMKRVRPHLPEGDPKLAHVFSAIEQIDRTAKAIREWYGLPPVV